MKKFIFTYRFSLLLAALVIASAIGINQYHFGMWNQYISLPWLEAYRGSEKFAQDITVQQWQNSPSFFLPFLAGLLVLFGNHIPALFFTLYLAALTATLYSIFRIGCMLFQSKSAGLLAMVVLSFSFPVIGDVSIWDSLLMERTLVYPLLLLSVLMLYQKKYYSGVVLQGLAFALHPLSALYIIGATWLAVLFAQGLQRDYWKPWALLALLLAPVFYLKFSADAAEPISDLAQGVWLEVMHLRNAHHALPTAYPAAIWAKTLGMVFSYFVLVRFGGFGPRTRRFFYGFGAAFLFMGVLGIVFTEIWPIKIVLQLQFFRSFLFLTTFAFILWAGLIITRPRPLYYLLAFPLMSHYFYGETAKLLAALLLIGLAWAMLRFWAQSPKTYYALALGYLSIGLLALAMRGGMSLDQGIQDPRWYEVQNWFAQNTEVDALAIVPPQEAGFRVQSGRNSYGDWYDGTKAFFSENYAVEWKSRMEKLHCTEPDNLVESYQSLSAEEFLAIWREEADKHSAGYVINYREAPLQELPVQFQNDKFVVYALPRPAKGLAQR